MASAGARSTGTRFGRARLGAVDDLAGDVAERPAGATDPAAADAASIATGLMIGFGARDAGAGAGIARVPIRYATYCLFTRALRVWSVNRCATDRLCSDAGIDG